MLDDLKYIHQRDGQDALGVAEKQSQGYSYQQEITWAADGWQPKAVVIAGMGGSGLAAAAMATIPGLKASIQVIQNYDLPDYADEAYLVICVSYSGNTEEILSIFEQAVSRPESSQPKVACISSGGQLAEKARASGLVHVSLPAGYQPRMTFSYQFAALAQLLKLTGAMEDMSHQLAAAAQAVEKAVTAWRPDVATKDNLAKTIAQELAGRSPVVYGGPKMFQAAYKWKISFNENAKNVAWCGQLPEFNHNEFIGWTSHPVDKAYAVIELRSQYERPEILKLFQLSDKLLSGRWPSPIVVDIPKGGSVIEDMAWAIALGDFVSIYLALLNGLNPTPVDLIEKFKSELSG
jgi:glucose/mannose-6-phosphate isomerase